MIGMISLLLLSAAEPVQSQITVTKIAPAGDSSTTIPKVTLPALGNEPHPEIVDPMMGLTPDDYPKASLRADEEGIVLIAVNVDVEGKPVGCTIAQSSGHPLLDERTCQVAMERASFRPARDKQGKAVASVWRSSPIVWRIPRFDPADFPPEQSYFAVTLQIAADGNFGECTIDKSGNIDVADACGEAKARHAKQVKDLAKWAKSVTDVIAISNKDVPPNVSKPEWGYVQSRIVTAQLFMSGVAGPISCETVLTEGWAFGGNSCATSQKLAPIPANPDWSKARTNYTEISTFGQFR